MAIIVLLDKFVPADGQYEPKLDYYADLLDEAGNWADCELHEAHAQQISIQQRQTGSYTDDELARVEGWLSSTRITAQSGR